MNDIKWCDEGVTYGVEERMEICTKESVWWVRLHNGQAACAAKVRVIVNPFPGQGQAHYMAHDIDTYQPGLDGPVENAVFRAALIEAGVWLGRMLERTGATAEELTRRRGER